MVKNKLATECLFKIFLSVPSVAKIGMAINSVEEMEIRWARILKICILALISVLWVGSAYAQKPEPIGIVTAVKGQVTVVSAGVSESVGQGARVFLGDRFQTGDNSGVKILFNDDTLISLGANTTYEITEFVYNPTKRKSISNILTGKIKAIIQKFEGESNVEFTTPNAVAGIKGTILYVDADKGLFCVLESEAFVRGRTKEVRLEPAECTRIVNGDPTDPVPFTDELKNELEEATEILEEAPSRDSLYKEEYPGKKLPHAGILPKMETTVPLEQPVDLVPGVNQNDEAPVNIVIPPPRSR
jgi:FecR-like protein